MIDYNLIPGRLVRKNGELKNKEKTVISIITPFYNGGETLFETANTVFSQTFPYFEWIIVDDGSKDLESLKKLEQLEKMDDRIKVFHNENGGPSIARDFGISQAANSSKYIFFLDCDDMMENNMLECLYWSLETHEDASFAYTAMTNFGDEEFVWERYLTVDVQKEENLICISCMVRKEDLLEVGCFGIKEKSMYEDWNLWLKLIKAGKKPLRINAPLFWYRKSNSGEFSRAKVNHKNAMRYVNETAASITEDVEIIQFPRCKDMYSPIINHENMILPLYKKDDKKTILFIFPWMVVGGADIFNIELIKRLDKKKYNLIVLTTLPNDNTLRQDFYENCNECYDMSTFLDREDYIHFVDYIMNSRNVDIVFNSNSTYGYAMLPFIKSKYKNVKIIDYVHSVDLKEPRGGFGRYTKDFESCIDKTLTCNNYTKNQLINDFGKKDVETLYIGTDNKRFDSSKYDKKKLKEKYGISEKTKVVFFIARLSEEKRPKLLVDIALEVLKERKDILFLVAGDGPLYKSVKKKIKAMNLENNFKLLGMVDDSEEYYAVSDVSLNCSRLEGLALTSYESLSMGVPVVSSDVGGQTELIDDEVGRIVHFDPNMTKTEKNNEIKEYSKAILEVLDNQEILSENAKNRIDKYFSYDTMVKKMTKIFEEEVKVKNTFDTDLAISIYRNYLDMLQPEYDWFCNSYCELKYSVINYANQSSNEFKKKLKRKIKNFSYKYRVRNEVNVLADFCRLMMQLLKNLKKLIIIVCKSIKYLLKSIYSVCKIILKVLKKIIIG